MIAPADPSRPDAAPERPTRRQQRMELAVFLFLIVPTMLLSFGDAGEERLSFSLLAAAVMARDLALVALVAFFLWRNREPLHLMGWAFHHRKGDLALGVLLFVPVQLGAASLESTLRALGLSAPSQPPAALLPSGPAQTALAVLLVLVVAVSEETLFRGYLLLRLRSLTGSSTLLILSSSLLFAIGHGYEGSAGVLTVGAIGATFAVVYLWRKSLVAPITLHFLVDFAGIVLLPVLKPT